MGETVKRVTVRVVVHDAADGSSVVRVVTVQVTAAHWRNVNHLQERKGLPVFTLSSLPNKEDQHPHRTDQGCMPRPLALTHLSLFRYTLGESSTSRLSMISLWKGSVSLYISHRRSEPM